MVDRIIRRTTLLGLLGILSASLHATWDPQAGDSWDFIQSVGGIAVGTPTRNDQGQIMLPVKCDVSGQSTVTVKPTVQTSTMTIQFMLSSVNNHDVLLSLRSGPARNRKDPLCHDVNLRVLDTGDYDVYYSGSDGGKHFLAKIRIPW